MKPVEHGEVLGLAEYEQLRDPFCARVIEDKEVVQTLAEDQAR